MKLLFWIFLFFSASSFAQDSLFKAHNYPTYYFRSPLNISTSLAGNLGDLRENHYHMGLDYRTQQKENLSLYAAADGYVSRVKVEPYGYGRAIYITHPNGLLTLYAHMNNFFDTLNNYVIEKQYDNKKWRQDIYFKPSEFKVTKGQFIGYSGNTGGSEGPHLHFEIRDVKTETNLNPQFFDMGIKDNIPPTVYKIALYNRNEGVYEFDGQFNKVVKVKNKLTLNTKLLKVPLGKFSFGVGAEDKTNASFLFGICQAEIYLDSVLQCAYRLNDFTYANSRYINAGIDYFNRYSGGSYMHHLSKLPGNKLNVFSQFAGDGVMQLNDVDTHQIRIVIKDATLNKTEVSFNIKADSFMYFKRNYSEGYYDKAIPGKAFSFKRNNFEVSLSANCVYDTVNIRYKEVNKGFTSNVFSFNDFRTPAHDSFTVKIKPNYAEVVSDNIQQRREKTVMVIESGKKREAQKGIWQGDWLIAKWWNFGNFYLYTDYTPPTIRAVNIFDSSIFVKDNKIVINAYDETGDLKNFEGFIDNQWVMFKQKKDYYTFVFDQYATPGWHTLKIIASDEASNQTIRNYVFSVGKPVPAFIDEATLIEEVKDQEKQ